jgi:2-polyprenyl-6-hydroxyphenyl methylase/3-demethylubiquinone-9 3-methyltransferase
MQTVRMFNFGENWSDYSRKVLDASKVEAARLSLAALVGTDAFKDRRVLDIGCGTGLFSVGASLLGGKSVLGLDVNGRCVELSREIAGAYVTTTAMPEFRQLSILDSAGIKPLQDPGFDIVYAWGSLHHTGDMRTAIRNAAQLVAPEGLFVLSIYNRHWSSPFWRLVKAAYTVSPALFKRLIYYVFLPVIYVARLAATRENPLRKERGMDFFIDTVDWLGGYPYEYATIEEIQALVIPLGFSAVTAIPGGTPIACNEFVFRKAKDTR